MLGGLRRWSWVRHFWFRVYHLGAIAVVALQSWLGMLCPLTIWENVLRERAGEVPYAGSFLRHWLHRLIYFQAEAWVFTLAHTVFAILVLVTWMRVPPRRRRRTF